jgi:phytol kinase
MLAVLLSLFAVLCVLLIDEFLWRKKIIHGELKRKLVHIAVMTFVAFWPWIMGWKAIQFIGIAMVILLLINRQVKVLHYLGGIRQQTYGDVFLALSITTAALLTDEKIFFAVAMLHVAWADGLAAMIGTKYGRKWSYKIFGQTKTILGSMVFWIVSLLILGFGLLPAHNLITFNDYALLLVCLPPVAALTENLAVFGMDNLAIPIVIIAALNLASM